MADEAMMAEFRKNGGAKTSIPKRKPSVKKRHRARPLNTESDKQGDLNKRWAFIRLTMLIAQKKSLGHYRCMQCGLQTDNQKHLDCDHEEPRRPDNYTPQNARLVCNRLSVNGDNSCHVRKHNQPGWSEAS